jgi:hypothetical protein
MAVATRPSTALFGAATGATLILCRKWKPATVLALGAAVPLTAMLLHMLWYTGLGEPGQRHLWRNPVLNGLAGLLVAPSRGLLVYSPAFVLVPLGFAWVVRGEQDGLGPHRTIIVAWALAAVATILVYARWFGWWGGWCFGPRYLTETLPIFALLFAFAYDHFGSLWRRRAACGLVALSVAVHFLGVFGNDPAWERRHRNKERNETLFSIHDTQIEAHFHRVVSKLRARLGIAGGGM